MLSKPLLDKDHLRSRDVDKIVLESLPISHYVEKVRWCLDYIGQEYEEEQDVGILGEEFIV